MSFDNQFRAAYDYHNLDEFRDLNVFVGVLSGVVTVPMVDKKAVS